MRKRILAGLIVLFSQILHAQVEPVSFDYSPTSDVLARVVDSQAFENGTSLEKRVVVGFDSKVPFFLIKPKISSNKFIILLHGMTYSKDNWIFPLTDLSQKFVRLKDSLLAIGYNVIIPDAKYHGERSYEADFASPVSFFSSNDKEKVYNMLSISVKDIRVILDHTQSEFGSDSTTFDVIGYSMGGMITILLNSVENRLNRVVVCVPPLDMQKVSERIGMSSDIARILAGISPSHFANLQKSPLTMLLGRNDPWYTEQEVQDFFDEISIEDKSLKFYSAGHDLPESFISDSIRGILNE